jgi:hypothetical protein
MLAAGHSPASSRSRAAPARRLAWVRDQSYEVESLPYLDSQSSMATSTSSRVHFRFTAPG